MRAVPTVVRLVLGSSVLLALLGLLALLRT